mgnify:CR=1 FL=1
MKLSIALLAAPALAFAPPAQQAASVSSPSAFEAKLAREARHICKKFVDDVHRETIAAKIAHRSLATGSSEACVVCFSFNPATAFEDSERHLGDARVLSRAWS